MSLACFSWMSGWGTFSNNRYFTRKFCVLRNPTVRAAFQEGQKTRDRTHLERHVQAALRLLANLMQLLVEEGVFLVGEADNELGHYLWWKVSDQFTRVCFRVGRSPNNRSTHPLLQVAHEAIFARLDQCHGVHPTVCYFSTLNGLLQLR
jgi:hypothetical protein